jgi:hypothetical protein
LEKEKLRLQELELQQREEELKKSYELTSDRLSSLQSPTTSSLLEDDKKFFNGDPSESSSATTTNKETSVRKEDLNA